MQCDRVWRSWATLAVTVAFAFAMALTPAVALAEPQLAHGYLRYTLQDKSVTIIDYTGDEEEVFVPAHIAGNPVNRIAMGAFYDSWTVRRVLLPDTVTDIDEGAFAEDQEVILSWNEGRGGAEGTDTPEGNEGNGNEGTDKDQSGSPAGGASTSNGGDSRGTGLGVNGGLMGMPFVPGTTGGFYGGPLGTTARPTSDSGRSQGQTQAGGSPTPWLGATPVAAEPGAGQAGTGGTAGQAVATNAPDANTVRGAGTPTTGATATTTNPAKTPSTADATPYALPAALAGTGAVATYAARRHRRHA